MPRTLAHLQKIFWQNLTKSNDQNTAKPSDPDLPPLRSWIVAEDSTKAAQRINIYSNAYFFRLHDVLQEHFEATYKSIGPKLFHSIVKDYLEIYPSNNPSLDFLGQNFPLFLQHHPPQHTPIWLSELAKLEWHLHMLLCAQDSPRVSETDLRTLSPEKWGKLRFQLIPAHAILSLEFPIHLVHHALHHSKEIPSIERSPCHVLLWRPLHQLYYRPLSRIEERAIRSLKNQDLYEDVCMCFLPEDTEEMSDELLQASIQDAYQALSKWLNDGLLAHFVSPK